ncbi:MULTISPECIES: response regulator transcription factor [Paenibacillus]|uniref:response regulator transcription factor n=1 Tax=Paenibacillus TaxID=44249 RepID=UPI0022B89C0D|nr:response regulator [Paenibacillus caseinilyticus]MCZ8522882.1 response regulator [Paenibacillus caseinilyticus]
MFTIMVADDEASVREPVCRLLAKMEGVDRVLAAGDGREAMQLLQGHPVQLVITDIRMPAVDGLELAGHIRSAYPETDVYVLTGHAEFDYAQKALQHQVADYLLKPLSKKKLEEIYSTAYGKYRQRRDVRQVDAIRHRALLEKRIHDLLHDVPLPDFDRGLIPPYEKIMLVSFSTKDLQSLGAPSVRYFIRGCAEEAFNRLGPAVVCVEDRLVTIVLFSLQGDKAAWEREVKETAVWMAEKLRMPVKAGYGGCTDDIKDLGLMYIRSVAALGFTEFSRRGDAGGKMPPVVRALLGYVHREYAGAAQLTDFAQNHQVNPNYLSCLFHQETGMTYSQYLTQHRLCEAKRLLRETQLKIYEVCEKVGYKDPAYFSRLFKTVEGQSPNDYRASAAGGV